MEKIWQTHSPDETVALAKRLGKALRPGDVLCLEGDLGAGKTTFSRGVVNAFLDTPYVPSPTFTIIHEYEGSVPVYHFDLYRVADEDELFEIGFFEHLERDAVCLIEWGSLHEASLPKRRLMLTLSLSGEEMEGRELRFFPYDTSGEARFLEICKEMGEAL